MRAVVFFSGGLMSWGAAKRTVAKYGADETTLLFTDTLIESAGLYRFLEAGAANVGARLVRLAEGRTPFQVFRDVQLMGNTRFDPCSRVLKRAPGERWLEENCAPAGTALVFGLDWTELHRFNDGEGRGVQPRYGRMGWPHVEAPMMDPPYIDRRGMLAWARSEGLPVSDAYGDGFAHDNCGGGCIKAGKGHWSHLLRTRPAIYARWEAEEEGFNARRPGKRRQTILRDEKEGEPTQPLSLRELRQRIQAGAQIDMFDVGGCGCFVSGD